jgi:hypothetical protein
LSCLHSDRILNVIEAKFDRESPSVEVIDGARVGHGLPERALDLREVRDILLDGEMDTSVHDAIWRELVRLARDHGHDWQLVAIWMMLPGLRGISRRLSFGTASESRDLEAEALAEFLNALQTVDLGQRQLGAELQRAAYRGGRRVLAQVKRSRELPTADIELVGGISGGPDQPDALLSDAVHSGVLSVPEAELINRTRLEGERLGVVAQQLGLRYHACQQRRSRAEGRLAGYVLTSGPDGDAPVHRAASSYVRCRRRPAAVPVQASRGQAGL